MFFNKIFEDPNAAGACAVSILQSQSLGGQMFLVFYLKPLSACLFHGGKSSKHTQIKIFLFLNCFHSDMLDNFSRNMSKNFNWPESNSEKEMERNWQDTKRYGLCQILNTGLDFQLQTYIRYRVEVAKLWPSSNS